MKFNDLQLADVRFFATAVEKGSLASAALALSVPKASASRSLRRLEEALGRSLLHRGSGRFALTEEGRTFLPSAHRMLANLDQAVAELGAQGGPLKGSLRIAAPYAFGKTRIAPCLADFLALNPEIDITLDLGSDKVDLLADDADLAVRIGDVGGDSLVARLLTTEPLVLCASPAYLAEHGTPEQVAELAAHRLLTSGLTGHANDMTLPIRGRPEKILGRIALRSNEPVVLAEAVRRGSGIALVPVHVVALDLQLGTLVAVLPDLDLLPMSVNAVYAPGQRQSRKVRAFLDFFIDHLRSLEIQAHPATGPLENGLPKFSGDGDASITSPLTVPLTATDAS